MTKACPEIALHLSKLLDYEVNQDMAHRAAVSTELRHGSEITQSSPQQLTKPQPEQG